MTPSRSENQITTYNINPDAKGCPISCLQTITKIKADRNSQKAATDGIILWCIGFNEELLVSILVS
jgi:hypothetical protein